jgi:hypothetical protein
MDTLLVGALVLFGSGYYYYDAQFGDAGMLGRARSVLTEAGSQSKCDQNGAASVSGGSDCWTVSGYRLVKDTDGLFRIYDVADTAAALGGVRKGAEGAPEVFADRSRLEKAVHDLEAYAFSS